MKTKLFYFLMFLFAITATNAQINSVAIVGAGVGGWPTGASGEVDAQQLTKVGETNVWQISGLVVVGGDVKFRSNNSWAADVTVDGTGAPLAGNWGKPKSGASFPTGTGAQNDGGSSNIPAVAGTYDVTFDVSTGNYSFTGGAAIPVVKLFGTATSDVSPSTGINMDTTDGIIYTLGTTTLLSGNAQFDVDATVVGALDFPSGTVTGAPSDFIAVPAGKYTSITYNNDLGTYTFVAAPLYNSVAIVGSGVAGGWGSSPDLNQMTTTDGKIYTIKNLAITAWDKVIDSGTGKVKFRQNNNWNDPSFGGAAFPIGAPNGDDLVVGDAGTYDCVFNLVTGVYRFSLSSQPPVSLVGPGAGGWPGADVAMPDTNFMATTDGENYTLNNLVLTDGPVKFRQDYAWSTSWGGTAFPIGSPSSSDFTATAGTWDVTFTRSTGVYAFTASSLAVKNFNAGSFKAYPNPTKNNWNITSNDDITSVKVFDVLGKSVYAKSASSKEVTVNAAELSKGIYFAKVSTANGTSTVKLVKE